MPSKRKSSPIRMPETYDLDAMSELFKKGAELARKEDEIRSKIANGKLRVTDTQYALLEHLAAVAIRQKAHARRTKTRFQQGWTGFNARPGLPLSTLKKLISLNLATACCTDPLFGCGNNLVRITKLGVEYLESVRGETIYA